MTDVFLLTIDSLRADHVGEDYFPNCWPRFSSSFTRFTTAYSNGVATPLSFPSIHTGRGAIGDGTLEKSADTIAELYNGYTFGISNNPHLRSERGYDRGFESFRDNRVNSTDDSNVVSSVSRQIKDYVSGSKTVRSIYDHIQDVKTEIVGPDLSPEKHRTATALLKRLREELATHSGFFWLHFMDPHYPFTPHKVLDRDVEVDRTDSEIEIINDKFRDSAGSGNNSGEVELTDGELSFLREMYGEILRYLDRELNQFFRHLRKEGRWEDSMILILSDHGESFGEQGVYNHDWTAEPIDPLVRVPLFVKYPENRHAGAVFDHMVQNGDLVSTLAEEFDWSIERPEHTRPFTEPSPRAVISKSNTAVRVTTDTGYAIKRNGSTAASGDVDRSALELLESSSIPDVPTLSGEIPDLDGQERRAVEERLEYLGYK